MPNQTLPEFRLLAFNKDAIPHRGNPLAIADILADSMTRGQGDSTGGAAPLTGSAGPGVNIPWYTTQDSVSAPFNITNLWFLRMVEDGTVSFTPGTPTERKNADKPAGFIIAPQRVLLDNLIGTTALTTGHTPLHWQKLSGTWKTALPPLAPKRTLIFNSGSEELAQVQTVGNFPANRGQWLNVSFLGSGQVTGDIPSFRYILPGGKYSLCLTQGQPAAFCRFANNQWNVWGQLSAFKSCDLSAGFYGFGFYRVANYIIVASEIQDYWFMETATGAQPGSTRPSAVQWPAGQLGVNVWNCKAMFDVSTIQWCDAAGSPFTGSFTRTYQHTAPIPNSVSASATGWTPGAGLITATPSVTANTKVDVTVDMTAGADGIDTPFVSKMFVTSDPTWTDPGTNSIDITSALIRGQLTMAQPPILAGSEMNVDIFRPRLDQMFGATGWQSHIDRYLPIQFSMRWRYDDGSAGDWYQLFQGYIVSPPKTTGGILENTMTLTCRDPIFRLQGDNARLDQLYHPADLLFYDKLQANGNSPSTTLYGWEIVQYILQTSLGFDEAARLVTYLNSTTAPVFSNSNDLCGYIGSIPLQAIPIRNGMQVPVPWKSDAYSWISTIGKTFDAAVFYYGWPVGTVGVGWPVPIYGNVAQIVAAHQANPTLVIPDRIYTSGDSLKLLTSGSVAFKPEGDVNVFEIIGQLQGTTAASDFIFAPIIQQARLLSNDLYNSPDDTWERRAIYDAPILYDVAAAQALATVLAVYQTNRPPQLPNLLIKRGAPYVQWGDLIQVNQVTTPISAVDQSDISLGVTGITFRVEKVVHSFSQAPGEYGLESFQTNLYGTALSEYEATGQI